MNLSNVGINSRHLGTRAREHLNLADINTKSAIKDHLYDCDKCSSVKHLVESFKLLKKCVTEYNTKIEEALLVKKLNSKLNKHLYAKGASFLLSILSDTLVRIIIHSYLKLVCLAIFCFIFLECLTFN